MSGAYGKGLLACAQAALMSPTQRTLMKPRLLDDTRGLQREQLLGWMMMEASSPKQTLTPRVRHTHKCLVSESHCLPGGVGREGRGALQNTLTPFKISRNRPTFGKTMM